MREIEMQLAKVQCYLHLEKQLLHFYFLSLSLFYYLLLHFLYSKISALPRGTPVDDLYSCSRLTIINKSITRSWNKCRDERERDREKLFHLQLQLQPHLCLSLFLRWDEAVKQKLHFSNVTTWQISLRRYLLKRSERRWEKCWMFAGKNVSLSE